MIGRLSQMTGRERLLVALLALVVLPLAIWYLGIQPLMQNRDRAIAAHVAARETLDWVREQDAAWSRMGATQGSAPPGPTAPVGLAGLEAALAAADLRGQVVTLENGTNGAISLGLDEVDFVALGQFLDRVETGLGYDIARLRITRADRPGQVDARLALTPGPS